MRTVPVSRVRRQKGPFFLTNSRGRHRVASVRRWGKNYAVTTEDGHFYVIAGTYLLERE